MATVSVENLKKLVDRALEDEAYADRLFDDPDAIAKEAGLSDAETLVLKQMNREQFDAARKDAADRTKSEELSEKDLAGVSGGTTLTTSTTTSDMIVGRSIISATGTSYSDLSTATCGCCPWAGSISTGSLTLPA